jgi:hypothetical protein
MHAFANPARFLRLARWPTPALRGARSLVLRERGLRDHDRDNTFRAEGLLAKRDESYVPRELESITEAQKRATIATR